MPDHERIDTQLDPKPSKGAPNVYLIYDMIGADNGGEKRHPQTVWTELGLRPLDAEPYPIADCWRLTVRREDLASLVLPTFIKVRA